jgi:hypothetical protein
MSYHSQKFSLITQSIAGPRTWQYAGTLVANMLASGFFADAKDKGVKVDDILIATDTLTNVTRRGIFSVVQDTGTTQGTYVQDTT